MSSQGVQRGRLRAAKEVSETAVLPTEKETGATLAPCISELTSSTSHSQLHPYREDPSLFRKIFSLFFYIKRSYDAKQYALSNSSYLEYAVLLEELRNINK